MTAIAELRKVLIVDWVIQDDEEPIGCH